MVPDAVLVALQVVLTGELSVGGRILGPTMTPVLPGPERKL